LLGSQLIFFNKKDMHHYIRQRIIKLLSKGRISFYIVSYISFYIVSFIDFMMWTTYTDFHVIFAELNHVCKNKK